MTRRALGLGLALVVGGVVASRVLGSRPEAAYGDGPLAPCPSSPNCALVRVPLAAPPARVRAAARTAVQRDASWHTGRAHRVAPTDDGLQATFTVGPFRDRLAVAVEAEGDGSVLWVRSRSEIGRSDLGINRLRVRRLVEAIRAELD